MSINLDIVEGNDGDGGYAAIRVSGLKAMPADPTFRIDPIDDAIAQTGDTDWPSGPRRPATVKSGDASFDLVLGPDVLESPLLVPGTPVIVSITDTAAEAELVWPSIATRRQRPRRPVIMTDELRDVEQAAADAKRREAAAALAAATARAAVEPSTVVRTRTTRRKSANGHAVETAAVPTVTTEVVAPKAKASGQPDEAATVTPMLSGFSPHQPSELSAATLIRKEGVKTAELPPPQPAKGTAIVAVEPPPAPPPKRFRHQLAAFVGGLGLAAALMFSLVQFRVINIQPVGQVAGGTPDVALTIAKNSGTLRTVLATGGVSPRGKTTSGIDGNMALRLADAHLYGTSDVQRDQGEASFWLRHALTQSIDHESMKWAYTQLGSIFAQPDGFEPDFAKARLLWEIAGALGDPVALCFNASLYEHGLGVPKHKDLARALYERARNAGGCRGVDDALKRTN